MALVFFAAITVVVVLGAAYAATFHSDGGDADEEGGSSSLREELADFAAYAKRDVASRARAAIVRVQRWTHRDEVGAGAADAATWRRLSDTNPLVRWVKRELGEDAGLQDSLIDENDDDYEDMMSEPYRFAEFADYVEEASPVADLDRVEDASVVRLPRARADRPSWLR